MPVVSITSVNDRFAKITPHIVKIDMEPITHPYVIRYGHMESGTFSDLLEPPKYMSIEDMESLGKMLLEYAAQERMAAVKEGDETTDATPA